MTLIDKYGRVADYLRLALTDRCNLRCRYCMPEEGIDFSDRADLLSFEEIIRLSNVFSQLGVKKLRLTGGEPFVRKDIDQLIVSLTDIFNEVYITTNATLLEGKLEILKSSGIAGLNISIDSLNRDRFHMITRRDHFDLVLANILASKKMGLDIKLNIVAMLGINDMELTDFIAFGMEHDIEVRFIEAMPFNEDDGNKNVFLSAENIAQQIRKVYPSLSKIMPTQSSSADRFAIDGKYKLGIIPAYTRSLCGSCNRIRLTPKGELLTCLYAQTGLDLRQLLRKENISEEVIAQEIIAALDKKKKTGYEEEALRDQAVFNSMTTIGG